MTSKTLRNGYLAAAVIWLNTCVLFLVITIATGVAFFIKDRIRTNQLDRLNNAQALRSLPAGEARALFVDFQRLGTTTVSRPWIGFSEPPWHSARINIDAADPVPVRRTPPPAAGSFQNEKTVWLFGGSTAMGYGVPDELTLAAQLQSELQRAFPASRITVINHAHLAHYSSQEILLFQWLVRSGKRADLAVFLDGVNDSGYARDQPDMDFSGRIASGTQPMVTFSQRFPPVRLFYALRKIVTHEAPPNAVPTGEELPRRIAIVRQRYLANVRLAQATGDAFGVKTLFVWQPSPFNNLERHPDDPTMGPVRRFLDFNAMLVPLNTMFRKRTDDPSFVYLGDVLADDPYLDMYLDAWHYGDVATLKLARAIAEQIAQKRFL